MSVRSAQSITAVFTTRVFATGVGTNADSLPTGALYLNGVLNAATVTVANLATGKYTAQVTLPTLAVSDEVEIVITATVSAITDSAVIWGDTKDVFAGAIPDVAAGGANGLFIAGTNAATAITTGLTAHIIGTVDAVTTLTNLPAIPANWITAAGITAAALNGKGDWMLSYVQPAGFLAATFPTGTIANTTNITAGAITTTTNLTNAPTAGDLTATMKTSVQTAADAAITANVTVIEINADADELIATIGVAGAGLTAVTGSVNVATWLGHAVTVDGNNLPNVNTADFLGSVPAALSTTAQIATAVGNDITDTIGADIILIKAKTDFLPSAAAGTNGGLIICGANAPASINLTGNITGNLSGSTGSVTGAVGSVTGNVGGNVVGSVASVAGAVGSVTAPVGVTSNIKKNQALLKFGFQMTDAITGNPAPLKTVTVTRSIDGAAAAAGTLANVAEIGGGAYCCDFGAGDLNGNSILLFAAAPGCNMTTERILTQP